MNKRKTESERLLILNQIKELREQGYNLPQAAKKVGISTTSYSNWMNRAVNNGTGAVLEKKRIQKTPSVLNISIPEEKTPFIFIMGKPEDVTNALNKLSEIRR